MARAGTPRNVRKQLIEGLPETFDEWQEEAWHDVVKQSQSAAETAKTS
jgi:hypothetical protein